jgi:hypothetical protein
MGWFPPTLKSGAQNIGQWSHPISTQTKLARSQTKSDIKSAKANQINHDCQSRTRQ